ncbi:unnamed protein product [Prorocentrum cordatum]|uniref:Transmembrane protein 138 n=1 Tax=Prorocentrum cordatum TaxID=2364126 RepID=A0ABN9R1R8_9DINO|nr:unnamed protein product [Polarella glacialis]
MYGLQCLLPFLMINVLNTIFDLFSLYKMSIMPYGFFLLASVVAEGGAAYFAYSAFKVCRDMQPSQGTEMEGGMGGGSGYVQARRGGGGRSTPSAAVPSRSRMTRRRNRRRASSSSPAPGTASAADRHERS